MSRIKLHQNKILLFIILLTPLLRGCECSCSGPTSFPAGSFTRLANLKETFIYIGPLPATSKGKPAATLDLKSLQKNAQGIELPGTLHFRGKLSAQTPGATLPGTLRFLARHKPVSGPSTSQTFDLKVNTDGTISPQNLPFGGSSPIKFKETAEYQLIPVDADLPASNLNLRLTFTLAGGSAPEITDAEIEQELNASPVKKEQFSFVGLINFGAQGKTAGHFRLKAPNGSPLTLNGKLKISGRMTPLTAGLPFPSRIEVTVKHLDEHKKVTSTDKLAVKVQSNGRIAAQSFAFVSAGGKESLDVLVTPRGNDFPESTVNLKLTYTPGAVSGGNFAISGNVGTADAQISFSGPGAPNPVTSQSDGSFSQSGFSNGTFTITPTKACLAFTPGSKTVTVAGANRSGVDFTNKQSDLTVQVQAPSSVMSATPVTFTAKTNRPAKRFNWDFGDGTKVSCVNCSTIQHTYANDPGCGPPGAVT